MKSHGGMFPAIYDFENLYRAHLKARLGKRTRPSVMQFDRNLEANLIQLQNELVWGEYKTGPYHRFHVLEPKRREIASVPYRDRVVQHSLIAQLEPIWEPLFIDHSYACRTGRGMHKGADAAQHMLRCVSRQYARLYVLKADISKYFASVNHAVLKAILRKKIRCNQTYDLCAGIIDAGSHPDAITATGMPIGNLTSQLWANIYLHELDKYVKHEVKARHYVRYMDDFVIVHTDKDWLHEARRKIETYLLNALGLKTNSKTQVFPVSKSNGRGLDFLGFHLWPTHRRLRKDSIKRIHRSLKTLQRQYAAGEISLELVGQTINSWVAHAAHADTYGLRKNVLGSAVFCKGSAQSEAIEVISAQPAS